MKKHRSGSPSEGPPASRHQREMAAARAHRANPTTESDDVLSVVAARLLRDLERLGTAAGAMKPAKGKTPAAVPVVRVHRKRAAASARG